MTTATDLCQTVGCNHRRDQHGRDGRCFAKQDSWHFADDCERFTEPPTVAEAKCDCDPGDASATGGIHRDYCALNGGVVERDDNLDALSTRLVKWAAIYPAGPHDALIEAAHALSSVRAVLDAERAKNTEALAAMNREPIFEFGRPIYETSASTMKAQFAEARRILGGKD